MADGGCFYSWEGGFTVGLGRALWWEEVEAGVGIFGDVGCWSRVRLESCWEMLGDPLRDSHSLGIIYNSVQVPCLSSLTSLKCPACRL